MNQGNIPAPIFNRKRPRQAIFAHPNNSQNNGAAAGTSVNQQSTGNFLPKYGQPGRGRIETQTAVPQNTRGGYQARGQNFPRGRGSFNQGAPPPGPPKTRPTFAGQQRQPHPTPAASGGWGQPNSMNSRGNPRMATAVNPGNNSWRGTNHQAANLQGTSVGSHMHPNNQMNGAQLPYSSPAKAHQPWGTPAYPNSGYNPNMSMASQGYADEIHPQTFTDSAMYPTPYQPPPNQPQPVMQQSPYPPAKPQQQKAPMRHTQSGATSSDKFKIKTKTPNTEENTMRLLSATVNRIKQWMNHKNKIPLLFEVMGAVKLVNPQNELSESSDVPFTLQDETGTIGAVFYEIDRSCPQISNGQTYRLVGLPDKNQPKFHCLSIRPANTAEVQLHLSAVNASDASMRDWLTMNEH